MAIGGVPFGLSFRTAPIVIPNSPIVIPNFPTVIPNAVRNLRSPSDGQPITTTSWHVSQHLRFFVVRSSE